jgi:hypothetical protein
MDEHWDGGGYPEGLRATAIPLAARIVGLSQVAESFLNRTDRNRSAVVGERRGWFDPDRQAFADVATDADLWRRVPSTELDGKCRCRAAGDAFCRRPTAARPDRDGLRVNRRQIAVYLSALRRVADLATPAVSSRHAARPGIWHLSRMPASTCARTAWRGKDVVGV